MTSIVTNNVTETIAPTPSLLQQTGAILSQGGTVLAPNTYSLLTQLADLAVLIKGSATLASLAWASSVVTATASAPHGFTIGDTLVLTITGAAPAGYNGTFLCTVTTTTAFTYALASSPGTSTLPGVYTAEDVAELNAQTTTFFAQGAQTGVYVLELGPGSVDDGVAALTAFIIANSSPQIFYIYLVSRLWDGNANYIAMLATFQGLTAKTYFFTTTTLATYGLYTDLQKEVFTLIEAPAMSQYGANVLTAITWSSGEITATTTTSHGVQIGDWFEIQGCVPVGYNGWYQALQGTTGSTLVAALAVNPGTETTLGTLLGSQVSEAAVPATEFSLAFPFWKALTYQPSSTNQVTQMAFSFGYGVSVFPSRGLSALLSTLKAANVNIIGTGAEGGIPTTAVLFWGTTMDGNDFTWWYSIDAAQIYSQLNLANTVINGSNDPINPLDFDQAGINRLQDTAVATMGSLVAWNLANGVVTRSALTGAAFAAALNAGQFAGQIVVNAVPYLPYLTANPGDYKIENYAGLSAQYIPMRGFRSIVFNLNVTDLIVL